ncbi:MAG: hypothetical protein WA621_16500 [Candidatus Acidiferrum sp.]
MNFVLRYRAMLKPYVCVACEKVIIAKEGDVPSLIGLMSKIVLTVPAELEIPRDAVAPKEWFVFSIWDGEPGDEQREYMLCTQVVYPDQTQFARILKLRIPVETRKRSQMLVQLQGFPIGQVGLLTVRTWVEEKEQQVIGPIEFKIELEINRDVDQKPVSGPLI